MRGSEVGVVVAAASRAATTRRGDDERKDAERGRGAMAEEGRVACDGGGGVSGRPTTRRRAEALPEVALGPRATGDREQSMIRGRLAFSFSLPLFVTALGR
jgi:hypothetical protein